MTVLDLHSTPGQLRTLAAVLLLASGGLWGCDDDDDGPGPVPDAAIDAALPDAELPDAELPDAELPDAELPDPCLDETCSGNGTCESDGETASCVCDDGYAADGLTCVDIDECADEAACDANATCTNTPGAFDCVCGPGYEGDGATCAFVGEACDPDAEASQCDGACVAFADGGLCVDTCVDDTTCPMGWRCDPEYGGLCLPNAACGELTQNGACEDAVLQYCGVEGPIEIDCAELSGAGGVALTCGLVSQDIGFDCVTPNQAGGCGAVPNEGTCAGTVLSYCASQANGEVVTVDCADYSQVCVVADGHADCADEGAAGCGRVREAGTCDGGVATFCQDDEVVTDVCADRDLVCGRDGTGAHRCVASVVPAGQHLVQGRFAFEKKALSEEGLGDVSVEPVKSAHVTVRAVADDSLLAEGYTAADGSYELIFEGDGEAYVLVIAQGEPGVHNHALRDCPMDDCGGDGNGNLHGFASANFEPAERTDLGETLITIESGTAGAFHIFDVFVRGSDFATANMGRTPPAVTVEWLAGSGTAGGTSYFSGFDGKIYVLGGDDDTDEYDTPVLLHEYGHYLEYYLSRSDSPGGDHDGSKTDPRLAWGEGYGTYVGCAIGDSPIYVDTTAAGVSVTDARIAGDDYLADLDARQGDRQLMSEYLILQILWAISQGRDDLPGLGHAPTFDVLANYFTSFDEPPAGRGVDGVELVDFLDGWFCRQHGERPLIELVIGDMAQFPYDYAGPENCEDQ